MDIPCKELAIPLDSVRKIITFLFLALYEKDTVNEIYEIVIGGWDNSQSAIRNLAQGEEEITIPTDDILSCDRYIPLASAEIMLSLF